MSNLTLFLFLSIMVLSFTLLTMRRLRAKSRTPKGADKLNRLRERLKSPEWQRYGVVLLAGKVVGIAVLAGCAYLINPDLFGFRVFAADAPVRATDIANPINTVWTLIAAFLVFGMQVGFTMLEAGFCRSRETVNVLMECIVDTCL